MPDGISSGIRYVRGSEMNNLRKTAASIGVILLSVGLIYYGILRGEADTVLAKAIKLCLECVGIG